MAEKPFKGYIREWKRGAVYIEASPTVADLQHHLGYVIQGVPVGHPQFTNSNRIRTSLIVKHDASTGEIETLNSRYQLID